MNFRLPPQPAEWIDRNRIIPFQFEGKAYKGFAGDVISSALWASGLRMLGRSFKYHRPRGVFSLAGHDTNVLLEDGRQTNVRGDMVGLRPGMQLRAVNTAGGLARDWLHMAEYVSRLMPVGFYYKAFHTPRRMFPIYENQLRKIAGLGKINAKNTWRPSSKVYGFCELLVVGAGPSGLSAAIAAAEQGVQVMLVDEQPRLGGSLAWQCAGDPSARGVRDQLLAKISSFSNIDVHCGTQAAGCYADNWVALVGEQRFTKLRAQIVLVATGCVEQPAVFQNNDLPGVMLHSAAQRLIHMYAVRPFDRCVVLTANLDGYRAAIDFLDAGVQVAAVADLRPAGESSDFARYVRDAGVPVHTGHTVYEALPGRDKASVAGAVICRLNGNGQADADTGQLIECDGVALSVGWVPNASLAYQAGGRFTYCNLIEQFVSESLPDNVLLAGRVRGIHRLDDQLADGHRAGLIAARSLGRCRDAVPDEPARENEPHSHPYPVFAHPGKKNFLDLDEDLHLVDLKNAHQEGYDNIELLKRYTTVGMGPSQGKLANMNAVRVLAHLNGTSINETGTTTSRPFYQPVSLGQLAGRRFHPQRRTPIHFWHADAGAVWMHAGPWLRPEYYRSTGKDRQQCILAEALHVRSQVGLIDLGTLGKIEVSGADATKLLERIYTGRFAKQAVGRFRYGVACDETGVVIEDGVIARLADDRFYISATTTSADAFYRELQRWSLIWNLNVMLVNTTGQRAAMNLAGPRSREVLSALTDVDLSRDSFPYVAVREGIVAGVPAILMRVGFVGELGYEIHVPASAALSVWTALMEAGQKAGIHPFGVEAQRTLRLEKGHLIVGQDTDALTNPFEADLKWAVRRDKPFFVGQRSLEIAARQPLLRKLVGFVLSHEDEAAGVEECHLMFDGNEIVGRLTSIARQSTLGPPLGMAFLRPDLAGPGARVQIRAGDGRLVTATVTSLPFYDPEGERQKS